MLELFFYGFKDHRGWVRASAERGDLLLLWSLPWCGLGCGFCMCRAHCLLRSNVMGSREWGGQKGECFKQASLRLRYCLQGLVVDRIFFSDPYLFPIRNVFVSWSSKRRVRVDFADEACGVQVHRSHWFVFVVLNLFALLLKTVRNTSLGSLSSAQMRN